jgi:hypothetical protein
MKIYWRDQNKYIKVVWANAEASTSLTGVNYTIIYEIDEILPDNQSLMLDIENRINQIDVSGNQKYQLIGENNALDIRDGWEEDNSHNLI